MILEKFKYWWEAATQEERAILAKLAGSSRNSLWQIAAGHRNASPDMAGKIAEGTGKIAKMSRHKPLPVVARGDLSSTCGECPYYKECKGNDDGV